MKCTAGHVDGIPVCLGSNLATLSPVDVHHTQVCLTDHDITHTNRPNVASEHLSVHVLSSGHFKSCFTSPPKNNETLKLQHLGKYTMQ